jgi:ATP-dependent Clp protease ATP-binding subunit ClpA
LFIDEIHMIMGAGCAGSSNVDVANLLKPLLGRGKLLTMGATTNDEYSTHFEKDKALLRRFQRVDIEPTDVPTTIEIMKGLKPFFEEFHGVTYTDELVEKSVDLADRYIKNKFFPDKAVDVMDASGAAVKLRREDTVKTPDIVFVISKMSKIGVDVIDIDSTEGYKSLPNRINTKVFGQALVTFCTVNINNVYTNLTHFTNNKYNVGCFNCIFSAKFNCRTGGIHYIYCFVWKELVFNITIC